MFDFHEKRKIRKWLYSRTTVVILLALALLLSFSVYERFVVERQVAAKRAEREGDLQRLQERAGMLESNIEYLQSDRGREEELRSRYDVAKEGEHVIIIVDEAENPQARTLPSKRKSESEENSFMNTLKFWE